MTFPFPSVLKARSVMTELRGFSRSGGRSLSGIEQRVFSDAGRWEIRFDGVPIRRHEQVRAWHLSISRLRAGENVIVTVPTLSNGSLAAQAVAVVGANAAARATQVTLHVRDMRALAGQDFSIGNRLYRIVDIVSQTPPDSIAKRIGTDDQWSDAATWIDDDAGAGTFEVAVVRILPPLRSAIAEGDPARFRDLTCTCVLSEMSEGDLALDLLRFGTPSITFIEDF